MSTTSGPAVSTGNLIFYYDMTNTQKSWKGAPTTNYIPNPYASWNGSSFVLGYNYQNLGATYTYRTGVDNPVNAPGVLEYYTGTSGYKYFSIDSTSLPSTTTYTFSYYARLTGAPSGGNNVPIDSQLWRANGSDRSVTGDWNPTFTYEWKRYTTTGPAEASTILQYFPVHSGNIIGGYTIQYCGFQLEAGSSATPFVAGTRSSSQALLDLTGRYTLTAANVTYSSNTFAFNGSNSCFDLNTTSLISGTQDFTIEAVYYTSATDTGGREIIGNYGTGATANTLWFATHGLWINGATPYHSGSPLRNGTYYTAATRLGSVTSLYKNGALELTGTNSTSIAVGQNWRIGKDVGGDGEPFLGNIYMIRVYNRALNAGEIYQNYNAVRNRYGI